MKVLSHVIREKAEENGWTLKYIAEKADVNYSSFKNYMRGAKNCPKKKIQAIADVLDIDWLEIVDLGRSYY